MHLLLIEDDDVKRERIKAFLRTIVPPIYVEDAHSLQSGLRALLRQLPDLVLLDMNLPTFNITSDESGGRPQAFAGREILRQMARRNVIAPVIVVTQFDYLGEGKSRIALSELDQELSARFGSNYVGYVYYQATQDDWISRLAGLIKTVVVGASPGGR